MTLWGETVTSHTYTFMTRSQALVPRAALAQTRNSVRTQLGAPCRSGRELWACACKLLITMPALARARYSHHARKAAVTPPSHRAGARKAAATAASAEEVIAAVLSDRHAGLGEERIGGISRPIPQSPPHSSPYLPIPPHVSPRAGDRLHAVSWFGDEKLQDDSAANKPGDLLNVVLNSAF